jgi:hypothetical protein
VGVLYFEELIIFACYFENFTIRVLFSIHELSMALVWLYYGFAMDGVFIMVGLNF